MSRRPSTLTLSLALGLCLGGHTRTSLAGPTATAPKGTVERIAVGPLELAVGVDQSQSLRATVCTAPGCALSSGISLDVPASLSLAANTPRFEVVHLGKKAAAILVTVDAMGPNQKWQAIVALRSSDRTPRIVFQGISGWVEGEDGLRHGPIIQLSGELDKEHTRRIVVGEQREDLTICGRPTIVMPMMLWPEDLELKPAKVQRLDAAERASAKGLVAELLASANTPETPSSKPNPTPSKAPDQALSGAPEVDATTASPSPVPNPSALSWGKASLLRAAAASSAIGWPAALTDGDLESTWSENRGGEGRGEFVVLQVPGDVPISAFDLVVRPPTHMVEEGAGPREFYLATQGSLYRVSFAEDPWQHPGAIYRVRLPTPESTSCVAVVLESSYSTSPKAKVSLAEIAARSEFAEIPNAALVAALPGGGPRAEAAASVLASRGEAAFSEVATAYPGLDREGRRVALSILDQAACEQSVRIYALALRSAEPAEHQHGVDHLRRCGPMAIPSIKESFATATRQEKPRVAEVLATLSPSDALDALVPQLVGKAKGRRALREIVARTVQNPLARPAIERLLKDASLPRQARVDLLRALGPELAQYAALACGAIRDLQTPNQDWRERFLTLGPIHALAPKDPELKRWLSSTITQDENPHVRAQAASLTRDVLAFRTPLLHALTDREVRVREAAISALGTPRGSFARQELMVRLADDDWPLVRAAAAEALAAQGSSTMAEQSLVKALDDPSPLVKTRTIEALGALGTKTAGPELVDRMEDDDETVGVRIAAARALGSICYEPGADALTRQARRLTIPTLESLERALALRSLAALAQLHPSDLKQRLQPLLNADKRHPAKQAAIAALGIRRHCHSPVGREHTKAPIR